MERTIPIDPILEKGYNVGLLVDDFDGLINTWFHRSVKFEVQLIPHLTVNTMKARKKN
ncbi:MAG: hypothetical protein Ct9H300mP4_14800 [Gammaproteobacteria bacterium]|nr:MAG: hypothetical protein Ct9H300mP4_14800 [Gammaproteobacteria bacterium]